MLGFRVTAWCVSKSPFSEVELCAVGLRCLWRLHILLSVFGDGVVSGKMAVGFCVGIEDIRKSAPRPAISSRRWCCCHMSDGTNTRSIGGDVVSRRSFLSLSTLAVVGTVLVSPGCARGRETSVGENSLAERVTMTEGVRPREKVMAPDIYYPEWMGGVWNSESVLTSVTAPFGETVFGRPGAFEAAKKVCKGGRGGWKQNNLLADSVQRCLGFATCYSPVLFCFGVFRRSDEV